MVMVFPSNKIPETLDMIGAENAILSICDIKKIKRADFLIIFIYQLQLIPISETMLVSINGFSRVGSNAGRHTLHAVNHRVSTTMINNRITEISVCRRICKTAIGFSGTLDGG